METWLVKNGKYWLGRILLSKITYLLVRWLPVAQVNRPNDAHYKQVKFHLRRLFKDTPYVCCFAKRNVKTKLEKKTRHNDHSLKSY